MKETVRSSNFTSWFAFYVFSVSAAYLFLSTFTELPENNQRIVDTIIGFLLGSVIGPIVVWAFRSSKAQVDRETEERLTKQDRVDDTTRILTTTTKIDEETK